MTQNFEIQRDSFTISTDQSRLDMPTVYDFLSRSYWAKTRPREYTDAAFANSLVFGIYADAGGRQVGMARVVTDYCIVAYLCDVFIHEDYRGHGLGKWLMQSMLDHPDLKHVRRWLLATDDAHGLYRQFGFEPLTDVEKWMQRLRPFPNE
jgi:GNAT superfamily N-acetyltransferase